MTYASESQPAALTTLIVHQSAELCGSDRSRLDLLAALYRDRVIPIVCLPENGPLEGRLKALDVQIAPPFKVRRRILCTPWRLHILPVVILRVLREVSALVKRRKIDLVYTNTLTVIAGAFWVAKNKVPHVWHVRVIIRQPRLASIFFRKVVFAPSDRVICNSDETRRWIAPRSSTPAITVWNGVESIDVAMPLDDPRASARKFQFVSGYSCRVDGWPCKRKEGAGPVAGCREGGRAMFSVNAVQHAADAIRREVFRAVSNSNSLMDTNP